METEKSCVLISFSDILCLTTRVRRQVKYTHIKNRYSVSLHGREAAMSPAFEGVTCNLTQGLSGRQQWGDPPVEWGAGLCYSVSAESQPEQRSGRLGARQTPVHLLPAPTQRLETSTVRIKITSGIVSLHSNWDPTPVGIQTIGKPCWCILKVPDADQ